MKQILFHWIRFIRNSNTTLVKVKSRLGKILLLGPKIQIQHLLKLNLALPSMIGSKTNSNTTLVKVKLVAVACLLLLKQDSNTTLVKVK